MNEMSELEKIKPLIDHITSFWKTKDASLEQKSNVFYIFLGMSCVFAFDSEEAEELDFLTDILSGDIDV